jgi:hypothetical protein
MINKKRIGVAVPLQREKTLEATFRGLPDSG